MSSIAFIDTEIDPNNRKIQKIGSIMADGSSFHSSSVVDFVDFIKGTRFICGHNIINHDIKYIQNAIRDAGINPTNLIDTLYFSPLLFPTKPYHALLKDDKLQTDDINNPLNDSIKARDLFYDEVAAFHQLDELLKQIFYLLLNDKREFSAFFDFIDYRITTINPESLIRRIFNNEICEYADLPKLISQHPVELAYCLSLIACKNRYSITPRWVLKNYPEVDRIMFLLRNKPCLTGCNYCNQALDFYKGLKTYFGFDSYRTYAGEPLQEKAVKAAIDNQSILAVFPTGGGKSITFQVPALMSGAATKGLTVIISPLQSLMKDQVDNLEKIGITDGVTINGLLDPIERAKSYERVEDGSASILYISPESLRSKSIERLILGRKIVRFVIDEAHCFSAWGQDFRVDYLYIGDFIKSIQEKKNLDETIPVSCFTATAKKKVIEDICAYFKDKLSVDLKIFSTSSTRSNLHYKVFERSNEEEKYNTVRDLIGEKNCPAIIYVSRTRRAYLLAERLTQDGFNARPYHGKMDSNEKTANQNAFISGEVQIMVATSAFGMGVDKKDVGMVIHYDISDSLENYIQEAGRAGRDEHISADCFVLFNEEDLSKHFILLNQTKLSIKEIQQVWKAIKDITKFRSTVSNSALEIARKAGWDDNVVEIETRVTTAIAALEDAGYLKRGQNVPRIFANSILSKNAQEAIEKINASERFNEKQKEKGIRIIKKLISSKSRKQATDETGESRIDHISDHLGIVKEEVINIINLLREEKILADAKDLTAFIKKGENTNRSYSVVNTFSQIENFLLPLFDQVEKTFYLKELNESAELKGCMEVTPNKIKTIINFWAIKNWIKRHYDNYSKNHITVKYTQSKETIEEKLKRRHELAKFIVDYLYLKSREKAAKGESEKEEVLIEFSVHELKEEYEKSLQLFKLSVTIDDIEDTLFYLSRIEAIKIEGGFLVVYNQLTLDRIEQDNKKRYKAEDYQKLNQFYENKVQQIHIVGEYAQKMIGDYKGALQFVEDYFQLNYTSFLNKYFPGSRQNEIKRNITPTKFRQLFGSLSTTQLEIIKDSEAKNIVVVAGPGSGKTRVLVHKLASLLLMEDVKHEQLLMLTFSRAAATEFKKRLLALIGNAANYIEIKTFHSYCFDLLGKVGNLEKSDAILHSTTEKIKNGDVEINRITKTVLVIDEAQDMNADEYALIDALIEKNEEMRVIAVGDDDQNIFEFRGASSKYLEQFIAEKHAKKYELIENYRSKSNLVEFTNGFVKTLRHRLKETPIAAKQQVNGNIKLVCYKSENLVTPLVNDILSTPLSGTTCVLAKTNEEALQINGLLLKNKVPARPIQSNDGFSLYNLLEVRFFLDEINSGNDVILISAEIWDNAKRELKDRFQGSSRLEICENLIKDFEATNPKQKYKSDFEVFIRESKLEDFIGGNSETIFVSTIHKAKGKEFDTVFIMLDNFNPSTDEAKRQLYVAMTRAKQNLIIHLNGNYLDGIKTGNMERIEDRISYSPPSQLAMQLTHKDVNLGYFEFIQRRLKTIMSGDLLNFTNEGCTNSNGDLVLKFSGKFIETIKAQEASGYKLHGAKVNFILFWKKPDEDHEFKIVLPELLFER
ncbi:MAG: RecQ family ATP-dependent DNA helicase [Prolixibacteraceae bacterium]|nr:RecQ family ATP-dependent DNA helicase [Prolixibacteraceae bacterium]